MINSILEGMNNAEVNIFFLFSILLVICTLIRSFQLLIFCSIGLLLDTILLIQIATVKGKIALGIWLLAVSGISLLIAWYKEWIEQRKVQKELTKADDVTK